MLTEVNIFSQMLLASDYNLHDDPDRAKPAGSSILQENMDPFNSQFSRLYQIAEVCSHLSCVPVPIEHAKLVTYKKDINGGPNTNKESAQKRKFPEEDIKNTTKSIEPVVSGNLSIDSATEFNKIKPEDDQMTEPPIKWSPPDPEIESFKDRCDPIQHNMNWDVTPTQMDIQRVEEDSVKPKVQPNRKRPRNTQQYSVLLEYNYALPPGKRRKMSPFITKRYHQLQGIQQNLAAAIENP